MVAMAASLENGLVRSDTANGKTDTIPATQNGVGSDDIQVVSNGGGAEKKDAVTGRKAREAERRRKRRSKKKKSGKKEPKPDETDDGSDKDEDTMDEQEEKVEVEYVTEKPDFGDADGFMNPLMEDFQRIFDKFVPLESGELSKSVEIEGTRVDELKKKRGDDSDDSDDSDADDKDKEKGLSNKKKKMQRRMKLAELKQQSMKPDVVEVWDATAADPRLLVFLKGYRNTVPVPRHWCQKRKFLQGKRGIEKQPFQLPDFIAATGIEKIRQAYIEKEDSKKLKQKQREKMQPKMGKMDIDYQVLHDAFFQVSNEAEAHSPWRSVSRGKRV
jgi:splicing factor 3B subunit 2